MQYWRASIRGGPVNPASLVHSSVHSDSLLQLLKVPICHPFVEFVCASVVITAAHGGHGLRTLPIHTPKFTNFVHSTLRRGGVTTSILLVALVYIYRARCYGPILWEEWVCERIFMGALIVASKYTQESSLKNVHWAQITNTFGTKDIGRIEREFLDVLHWDLHVSESDLLRFQDGLIVAATVWRRSPGCTIPMNSNIAPSKPV
ncbi:cyclin N-terminal domain-containing protein [Favolaschia claudopus]|uniref:Cyclin N-terminal domain-containing protein n=1 Tax=Favolaschia claudopus TaxID=2862362 RepID=A0AAW0A221_9AGAR